MVMSLESFSQFAFWGLRFSVFFKEKSNINNVLWSEYLCVTAVIFIPSLQLTVLFYSAEFTTRSGFAACMCDRNMENLTDFVSFGGLWDFSCNCCSVALAWNTKK